MLGKKICVFVLVIFSLSLSQERRSEISYFGSFIRVKPDSLTEWAWTEITLSAGHWFTMEFGPSANDFFLGKGIFEQVGDTLILKNIESSNYLETVPRQLDNLVIPEKRYLMRARKKNSFEVLSLEPYSKPSKWTKLIRVSPQRSKS